MILISLVPVVNFVMFLVFAFSKWPIEVRLEEAERGRQSGGQLGAYGWDAYGAGTRAAAGGRPWGQSPGRSEGAPGPRPGTTWAPGRKPAPARRPAVAVLRSPSCGTRNGPAGMVGDL